MDDLCNQIKQLATDVSCKERHAILGAIQNVFQDIESPEDARARVRSRVCQKLGAAQTVSWYD